LQITNLLKKPKSPYVYICGAGPGDPLLLTLKTHHLLTHIADIVVYDRLIPEAIIDLIPDDVPKIYAGKSCRNHHMTQDEINQCLVEQAASGKVVVRLKGGDPFIFGRGGEEMLHLVQNNIPYEVVPGVNAADGCAAYADIPLTHRGISRQVVFLTGHQQKGSHSPIDYASLAKPDQTLVIFMGVTQLEAIITNLLGEGMDQDTPCAAISGGTTESEILFVAPLKNFYQEVLAQELPAPTLIIIGQVVSLSDKVKQLCEQKNHSSNA